MVKMEFSDNDSFSNMLRFIHDLEENVPKIIGEVNREGLNDAEQLMHEIKYDLLE